MASNAGQRKRKSAGLGDIFEVNDGDLSPEPEDVDSGEPEAKITKTRGSDVSESKANNGHNLNNEVLIVNDEKKADFGAEDPDIVETITDSPELNQIPDKDAIDQNSNKSQSTCISATEINSSQEIVTIEDDADNSKDDVIVICDSTLENSQILEEGEVVDVTESSILPPEPSITIRFRDQSVAAKYKLKLLDFLQNFVEVDVEESDNVLSVFCDESLVVVDHTLASQSEETLAENLPLTPKSPTGKKKRKKKPKNAPKDLFIVDTNPNTETERPKYHSSFSVIENDKPINQPSKAKPMGSVCFNCNEEHSLKDCPHPRNFHKINESRQKFNKSKTVYQRYHQEEDQKFAHLKPGKISDGLRKALGLKKHQSPGFIYQMRLLGYPPGWLEEARFVQSELTMFDIDGNNVASTKTQPLGLDPDKVVDYPGFNMPFEKDFKDEYKHHRVPPFNADCCKENMIEMFKKFCEREQDKVFCEDMDVDVTNDEQKDETAISIVDTDTNDSLPELEKKKNTLLEEIKKSDLTIPWDQPNGEKIEQEENDTSTEGPAPNPIKHSMQGTPILKSASKFTKLPDAEKWAVGVSQVIDFENLPNSTGKYEQMTGVLRKVRDTLKGLNKTKT